MWAMLQGGPWSLQDKGVEWDGSWPSGIHLFLVVRRRAVLAATSTPDSRGTVSRWHFHCSHTQFASQSTNFSQFMWRTLLQRKSTCVSRESNNKKQNKKSPVCSKYMGWAFQNLLQNSGVQWMLLKWIKPQFRDTESNDAPLTPNHTILPGPSPALAHPPFFLPFISSSLTHWAPRETHFVPGPVWYAARRRVTLTGLCHLGPTPGGTSSGMLFPGGPSLPRDTAHWSPKCIKLLGALSEHTSSASACLSCIGKDMALESNNPSVNLPPAVFELSVFIS